MAGLSWSGAEDSEGGLDVLDFIVFSILASRVGSRELVEV